MKNKLQTNTENKINTLKEKKKNSDDLREIKNKNNNFENPK